MKFFLFAIYLVVTSFSLFAQDDTTFLSRAISLIDSNSEKNPIEKVYLHLDKPYYAAGDDIWFKAYVTEGSKHELSDIGGVLNVELINYNGLIVQNIKLPLVSGLTWGDFKLPDTLHEGNYRVRSYTNWMRNAGDEYFYDHHIIIGNIISPVSVVNNHKIMQATRDGQLTKSPKTQSLKTNVQFFPEGGNLIYGIDSKIAFKAIGDDGSGKDITGVVVDEQNREITRFGSGHAGMGVFNLLPASDKTYRAMITYQDGSQNYINMPVPSNNGYVLRIDNKDSLNIQVKVETGTESKKKNPLGRLSLIALQDGEIYYAAQSKSICSSFTVTIPKSKFPSGITQFTLFSPAGEPLNERLIFIWNPDQLKLSISPLVKYFQPRGKMKIELDVKNDQGKPVFGNFSVSITDQTKVTVDETSENTIISNLLLTSDLKGYVENPNYYFTNINPQTKEDLDVLMLTQGYRHFAWKQILDNNFPPIAYQPESSLAITGRLKTLSGTPLANARVSLLSLSKGFLLLDRMSDSIGYFAFKNLLFKDSVKFIVQSKTDKNKSDVRIELDTLATSVTPNKNWPDDKLTIDTGLSAYLTNSKKVYNEQIKYGIGNHVKVLKEVKIEGKKILPNSSNLNGPGHANQVLLAKDIDTGCPTIADCLIGKLRGVFFKYDYIKGIYYPCIYQGGKSVAMGIRVDDVSVDAETLSTLPPEIVESVEVLRSGIFTSIYGGEASNGLLLVNTKKRLLSETYAAPNIITVMPKGFYKTREFYSPQYDNPKTNKQIADLRTTIYWNPNIASDKEGKASFGYFNADTKGTYRVVVEGIDGNGDLGRQVFRYRVE